MIVELKESMAWSAPRGEPLEIRALSGTIWVTQEADPEDHILAGDEVFVSRRRGRVAIQSLTPARIEVVEAAPAHRWPPARAA